MLVGRRLLKPAMAAAVALALGSVTIESAIRPPKLNYQISTLDNGLTVVLSEDHSTPIVHVEVWYRVGSKNEPPGRTGFAHLFEHLMFKGSHNILSDQHLTFISRVGGRWQRLYHRGRHGVPPDRSGTLSSAGPLARGRSDGYLEN